MANVNGYQITIKAFIPTTGSVDDQMSALAAVKAALEDGDYSTLLSSAQIDTFKVDQKTRRTKAEKVNTPEADETSEA